MAWGRGAPLSRRFMTFGAEIWALADVSRSQSHFQETFEVLELFFGVIYTLEARFEMSVGVEKVESTRVAARWSSNWPCWAGSSVLWPRNYSVPWAF